MQRLFRYSVSKLCAGAIEPVSVFDAHVLGPEHQRRHAGVRGGDLLHIAQTDDPFDHRGDRDLPIGQTVALLGGGDLSRSDVDVLGSLDLGNEQSVRGSLDDHVDVALGVLGTRGVDADPDLAAVPVDLA